jgi:hypothetical protein
VLDVAEEERDGPGWELTFWDSADVFNHGVSLPEVPYWPRGPFRHHRLRSGDALNVTSNADLTLRTDVAAELILIDVPLEFEPVGVWAGEF